MAILDTLHNPSIGSADGYYESSAVQFVSNCVTSAPGLEVATSAHLTVENANTFFIRQGVKGARYINYLAASTVFPTLTGANLAFDNGTVPKTVNSCRIYTFFAQIVNGNTDSPSVVLSVAQGADFPKHRNAKTTDFNLGNGSLAIVGFLYVKNESNAIFIPGTTALNASGITASPSDAFGFLPITN